MKNELDITKDLKPLRPPIPPTSYFHGLADSAIQNERDLRRNRIHKMLVFAVTSLAACWMLVVWLLPSTERGYNKTILAKTESLTNTPLLFNKPTKKQTNSVQVILKKVKSVKSIPQKRNEANDESEFDLSSLSRDEVLTYLDEEEIDLMELEEIVNGSY
jgi:hypothetical protein